MKIKFILAAALATFGIFVGSQNAHASGQYVTTMLKDGSLCNRAQSVSKPVPAGTSCTMVIQAYGYGNFNYWLQYRKKGQKVWKRFAMTRTFTDSNQDGEEILRFKADDTRTYRVAFDTNNNGFVDFTDAEYTVNVK